MNLKKTVHDFENDFRNNYDINLQTELSGGDKKVDSFFYKVKLVVEEEIKSNNPTLQFDSLKEKQKEQLWKAVLEQANYMFHNYDMNIVSGYDPISNSVVSVDEIRKRSFSPFAKKILLNAGLLYRGLANHEYGYQARRRGWR